MNKSFTEKRLLRAKENAKKLLKMVAYDIDEMSFCMIAAQRLDIRFIIVIVSEIDKDLVKWQMAKLEKWPAIKFEYGEATKEIWLADERCKQFTSYVYDGKNWCGRDGEIFSAKLIPRGKSDQMAAVSRGRIDRKTGCVYFIYSPHSNIVKIGKTTNLPERLKIYQTLGPDLNFLGAIKSKVPYQLELSLHKRFAKYRIEGEWFQYRGELKRYIESQCQKQ